jgi:GR25 family glycosyltransferase involved in LPS biosynthesis
MRRQVPAHAFGLVGMFRGLFINLDRDRDRLQHMQAELKRFGLANHYERLRAVDVNPGRLGCFRSHLKALDYARRQHCPVHIIEDDSILSARVKPFLNSPALGELLQRYDMLFLDMWIDPSLGAVNRYRSALANPGPMDLKGTRVACTSSYVVSPRSAGRLLKLLKVSPPPIDARYSELVQMGTVSAAVMVPFLTGVEIDLGSLSHIQQAPRDGMRNLIMLRTAFFVDPARQPVATLATSGADVDVQFPA